MKITCRNCDGEMETLEIKKFEINQFMDGGFEAEATELDNHTFLLFGERLGTVVIEDRKVENIRWSLVLIALSQKIDDIKLNIEICKKNNALKSVLDRWEDLLNNYREEYRKILIMQQLSNK